MRYDIGPGLWEVMDSESQVSTGLLDGITVSESGKVLTVEALTPHINPKTIKVTYTNGHLTVSARRKS